MPLVFENHDFYAFRSAVEFDYTANKEWDSNWSMQFRAGIEPGIWGPLSLNKYTTSHYIDIEIAYAEVYAELSMETPLWAKARELRNISVGPYTSLTLNALYHAQITTRHYKTKSISGLFRDTLRRRGF